MSLTRQMYWARKIAPGFFGQHGSNAGVSRAGKIYFGPEADGRRPTTSSSANSPITPTAIPGDSNGATVVFKLPAPASPSGAAHFPHREVAP